MHQVDGLLLSVGRQVGDGGGGPLFAQQGRGQGGSVGHGLGGHIADGSDVTADLQTGLAGGRVAVDAGDAAVAGGRVVDDGHADAGQLAGLNGQALAVSFGGVVAGVFIVDAQHVTSGQGVVQRVLVDSEILVGADKTIDFGQLVVLALLAFDAGHGGVEHIHRDNHRQRKSDRHGDQGNGDGNAETNFFAHGFRWLLTK